MLVALIIVTFSSIAFMAIIIDLLSFVTVITVVMINTVLARWMAITHVRTSSYIYGRCGSVHSCSSCMAVIPLVQPSLVLEDSVLLQSSQLSSLLLLFITIVVIVFIFLCIIVSITNVVVGSCTPSMVACTCGLLAGVVCPVCFLLLPVSFLGYQAVGAVGQSTHDWLIYA